MARLPAGQLTHTPEASKHSMLSSVRASIGSRHGSRSATVAVPRLAAPLLQCRSAGQARLHQLQYADQSKASHALQQQQDQRASEQQQPGEHHINQDEWDLSYWHYQPWWLQPPMIIATGLAFVAASLVLDNEELSKTALLATGPVAVYWGIFLFVLPRRFKSFAVEYIESHPEAEEAAREQQQQQVLELLQQQQEALHQQEQQNHGPQ